MPNVKGKDRPRKSAEEAEIGMTGLKGDRAEGISKFEMTKGLKPEYRPAAP